LHLFNNNKIFSASDLSSFLESKKYLVKRNLVNIPLGATKIEVDIIEVDSSGVITILGTFNI
jgi:hypothetical protein